MYTQHLYVRCSRCAKPENERVFFFIYFCCCYIRVHSRYFDRKYMVFIQQYCLWDITNNNNNHHQPSCYRKSLFAPFAIKWVKSAEEKESKKKKNKCHWNLAKEIKWKFIIKRRMGRLVLPSSVWLTQFWSAYHLQNYYIIRIQRWLYDCYNTELW